MLVQDFKAEIPRDREVVRDADPVLVEGILQAHGADPEMVVRECRVVIRLVHAVEQVAALG